MTTNEVMRIAIDANVQLFANATNINLRLKDYDNWHWIQYAEVKLFLFSMTGYRWKTATS